MRNPIIAALDVPAAEQALTLAEQIAPAVGAFKIGSELFTSAGPDIVKRIRATGASVFLDLKFHDIPNTVAKAVASAVQLDVQMLTVHTSGGFEMLRAAEKAVEEIAWKLGRIPPLVLGVTVLTSLDAGALREIGLDVNVEYQVRRLATVAVKAGLRGLVRLNPGDPAGERPWPELVALDGSQAALQEHFLDEDILELRDILVFFGGEIAADGLTFPLQELGDRHLPALRRELEQAGIAVSGGKGQPEDSGRGRG